MQTRSVWFDCARISIFGDGAPYDLNFLTLDSKDRGMDALAIIKQVLREWAEVLGRTDWERLFLPFGFEDDSVEGFIATRHGDRVTLRCARVSHGGRCPRLRALAAIMTSNPTVAQEYAELFGTYDLSELRQAIADAEPLPA